MKKITFILTVMLFTGTVFAQQPKTLPQGNNVPDGATAKTWKDRGTMEEMNAVETITLTWQALAPNNLKFATFQATEGKNYVVDWGDGSGLETITGSANFWENEIAHQYALAGSYNVTLTGTTEDCHFLLVDVYDIAGMNNAGVTALNVSGLTQLKVLGTSENPMSTLNVSGCTSLEELLCERNQLAELNLNGLSGLKKIYCGNNQLTSLDLNGLTNLTEVSCPTNKLTTLNVSGCTALTQLICEMNELTQLDVSGLTALEDVRCNHNQLATLNVSGCTSLRQLWCYNNALTGIDVSGIGSLFRLWCYNNELTTLNASNCTALQQLYAENNQLTTLTVNGCTSLEQLLCQENRLTTLSVSGLTALSELRCSSNQLTALNVTGLTRLTLLHCQNNQLADLNMTGVTGINSLDCSANQLTSLNLGDFTTLWELRCFENSLQLSDLYAASEKISNANYKHLGTQTLASQRIETGETADFSAQREFGGVATVFYVEKDASPAVINTDYTIVGGVITFLKEGNFQITMTNDAIVSYSGSPAKVIAEYIVERNNIFTISSSSTLGGIINPTGPITVTYGSSRTFTFTSNTGYELKEVEVDGINVPEAVTSGSYTFTNITSNHSIVARFEKLQYIITSEASGNGNITPSGEVSVNYGESQTFIITPNSGYAIEQVLIDGVNNLPAVNNGSYTFTNVRSPHTISVTFKQAQYTITTGTSTGGTITPSGIIGAAHGDSKTFFIVPDAGYKISQVLVDGIPDAAAMNTGSHTFYNISTNHTISATFEYTYSTITATAGEGGNITPSGITQVHYGQSQYYTITPDFGYKIASIYVDGVNNASAVANGTYLFTDVTISHTIEATFERIPHTILSESTTGGIISPIGITEVTAGGSQTYSITVNEGYTLTKVLVDGHNDASAVTSKTYTFSDVTTNHTIKSVIEINTYTLESIAGEGGQITPVGTTTVNYGSSKTYTITPNTGYEIDEVLIDGTPNENAATNGRYIFEDVKTNHTILVSFKSTTFTLTATIEGGNGVITPNGETTVDYGTTQTYTITPDEGYKILEVLVDDINKPGSVETGNYTFNHVMTSHTIVAKFSKQTFTITSSASTAGGTITPEGKAIVDYGEDQTYTITPDEGYEIADVFVDGASIGKYETYTFENVISNHTIEATFHSKTTLDEVVITKLTVYPNPTIGELKIRKEGLCMKNINIFDITGRLVFAQKDVADNEATIDLTNYSDGIYFIRIDEQTVKVLKR